MDKYSTNVGRRVSTALTNESAPTKPKMKGRKIFSMGLLFVTPTKVIAFSF
jgi:hypothetical protein